MLLTAIDGISRHVTARSKIAKFRIRQTLYNANWPNTNAAKFSPLYDIHVRNCHSFVIWTRVCKMTLSTPQYDFNEYGEKPNILVRARKHFFGTKLSPHWFLFYPKGPAHEWAKPACVFYKSVSTSLNGLLRNQLFSRIRIIRIITSNENGFNKKG